MDQGYPDIPGAKEYYGEVIEPSVMAAKAYEVLEMQFFEAYGGCTRGYSSERPIASGMTKEEAEKMAQEKMKEKGIGAPFYYSTRLAK